MSNISIAISESAYDFEHIVWPVIAEHMGGGRIIPVETVTDTVFTKELDTLAGVDAWHVISNGMGMTGIASRVQWRFRNGDRSRPAFTGDGYATFTIRWHTAHGGKTEIDKRSYAIMKDHGDVLYPAWTVQAYMEEPKGEFLSGAIIKTRELILAAIKYGDRFPLKPAPGGNMFKAFPWSWLNGQASSLVVINGDRTPSEQPWLFNGCSP